MFLFPCIYIFSFLFSLYSVIRGKTGNVLFFFVFGLPIYFTSLSITFLYGFAKFIPAMQSFKEILIVCTLGLLLSRRNKKIVLHKIDLLILSFILWAFIYLIIPLGSFGIYEKFIAFKSLSFFPFVYFTGRFILPVKVDLNKYYSYICLVAILAAIVLGAEILQNQHLQTYTGYADYNFYFFGQQATGHYGLSWTFETANGLKRFASFFGMPLELGANTLLFVSVIAAMATRDNNAIKTDGLINITFIMTALSIFFAISRASFISYFIIFYVYAFITERKLILKLFHYGIVIILVLVFFFLSGDIYELIITTLDFSDSSSAFHVLQWLDGIDAIASHPLGLGLGMSGRVSAESGSNIGGENQLIIIGVQTGIVSVLIYVLVYAYTIHCSIQTFKTSLGKQRRLSLLIVLVKVGMIIPLLTANVESYIYTSYITWFLTGLLVSMIQNAKETSETAKNASH